MKNGYTENGTNQAGNTIYTNDHNETDYVFVGNDGFISDDWGRFTIQVESDGQWNEIENGRVDTEIEAAERVKSLVADGFCSESEIRFEQI